MSLTNTGCGYDVPQKEVESMAEPAHEFIKKVKALTDNKK